MIAYNISNSELLHFYVATKQRTLKQWGDENCLTEIQLGIADTFGVAIIDGFGPREYERGEIQFFENHARKLRRPLVLLKMGKNLCSITLYMDPMGRDRNVHMGGMTTAESTAIDELMSKKDGQSRAYRRELRGSPIIRRWSGVDYIWAFELATEIFDIIMGAPPNA